MLIQAVKAACEIQPLLNGELQTIMTQQSQAPDTGTKAPETPAPPTTPYVETPTKFFFKAKTERDANGEVIKVEEVDKDGKKTGKMVPKVIPAPEPISINLPLLTAIGLRAILDSGDEKQITLLVEGANNVILS